MNEWGINVALIPKYLNVWMSALLYYSFLSILVYEWMSIIVPVIPKFFILWMSGALLYNSFLSILV